MSPESNVDVMHRFVEAFNRRDVAGGKVTRIELFTKREPALEAAGLTAHLEEEKR